MPPWVSQYPADHGAQAVRWPRTAPVRQSSSSVGHVLSSRSVDIVVKPELLNIRLRQELVRPPSKLLRNGAGEASPARADIVADQLVGASGATTGTPELWRRLGREHKPKRCRRGRG